VNAFEAGEVQAVLHGTRVRSADGPRVSVEAIVPAESIRTTVVVVQLRRVLSTLETMERNNRAAFIDVATLPVPDKTDASPYFGFTYTVLVPLLLFLPPFISGAVAVDAVTEEIERGTLELLRVAPVSLVDIVDGKALGLIALAPAQVLLWLGLLAANGITVGHPVTVLGYVTGVATFVVAIGIVLGLATRRRRRAQLLYSTIVLATFGLAAVLPEHPATTVTKLAISSASPVTFAHAAVGFTVAMATALVTRRYVTGLSAETL
ncbi:MAG: ABC transporter permease, partial [Salinirussus sp.]